MQFPHEGFVQGAIEAHFRNAGYALGTDSHVDLLCRHPETGETWHIEAKGVTTQIGLDFRTCLGQLVQAMSANGARYGVAIPDTAAYHAQVAKLSPWVVDQLQLHWLLVALDGSVRIVTPTPA